MDTDAGVVDRLVSERIKSLRRAVGHSETGRGSRFVALAIALLDHIDMERDGAVSRLGSLPPGDAAAAAVETRALLRLLPPLDAVHWVVADYREDVGRQDLPVGLLNLVDQLVMDLLPARADPLIHLDSDYMYSTLPLVEHIGDILTLAAPSAAGVAKGFPEPHPVVFNLPALDPGNTLLSPILAHEVGHSACTARLMTDLANVWPVAAINSEFTKIASTVPVSISARANWSKTLRDWCEELLCDAVATVLTGPSFLFASAIFLPAPAANSVGSHPHERDRIGFTLRLLDRLGWTDFLASHAPEVTTWCRELAAHPVLDGTPKESFLRAAMSLVEDSLVQVATNHVTNALSPAEAEARLEEATLLLSLEVPPVSVEQGRLTPWQIVLFGWISEIDRQGGSPEGLARAASQSGLNEFLVKTLELNCLDRLWEETAP